MGFAPGGTIETLRTVIGRISAQNVSFLAGSLAYSAFVSLLPLLLLAALVAGSIGEQQMAARIAESTQSVLTPAAQGVVVDALTNTTGRTGLSVAGLLVLFWGMLRVFRGLSTAFAVIYETTDEGSFLTELRDGAVAVLALGLAVVAVAVAGAAFAVLPIPFLYLLNPLLLLVGLSAAFFPLYYVLPDAAASPREVLPGAVVAAGGWAILEVLFQLYAAFAGRYEAYGVLGSVLLLVTWLYFGSFALLVGAEVNAVLWGRRASTPAAPTDEASGPPARIRPDERAASADLDPRQSTGPARAGNRRQSHTNAEGAAAAERPAATTGTGSGGRDRARCCVWASRLAIGCGALLIATGVALRRALK